MIQELINEDFFLILFDKNTGFQYQWKYKKIEKIMTIIKVNCIKEFMKDIYKKTKKEHILCTNRIYISEDLLEETIFHL